MLRNKVGRALLTACLATALFQSVAVADEPTPEDPPPAGFPSWPEFLNWQDTATSAGSELNELATETGFTGIELVPEQRLVKLHWNGMVTPTVLARVNELRRTVPIDLRPARHSLAQLQENQDRIAAARGVVGVFPHVDGSGLTVDFNGTVEEANAEPAIRDASVPIRVQPQDRWWRAIEAGCVGGGSRQNDCSRYVGGAQWRGPGTPQSHRFCSTGFAVLHEGRPKMLSSGHCGANGQIVVDGGGQQMGIVDNDNNVRDTLLINHRPLGLGSVGKIYVGPPISSAENKVVGSAPSLVGQYSCTSGAATGWHCYVRVTAVNAVISTDLGVFTPMVIAQEIHNKAAAGLGDSGGPVVLPLTDARVRAVGTISAGHIPSPAPCPPGSLTHSCYARIAYADVQKTLTYYQNLLGTPIQLMP